MSIQTDHLNGGAKPARLECDLTCWNCSTPHPDCNVQEAEYKRLLGYPGRHVLEGRAREIADATRQWYAQHGQPWIYAREADALELAGGQIWINGAAFSSVPAP